MTGIFDPTYYWIPLGVLAFAFALVNMICSLIGKRKGWQILLFLSLACGVFALLAQYQMINEWVQRSDWSALMDVVPGISDVLTFCTSAGVILNAIILFLNIKRKE